MRLVRGLASLVCLVLLLAGVPWLLLRVGVLPPWSISAWLAPDDGRILLGLLTLVGWAAWAVLALATVVEAVNAVRGVRLKLPGLGWAQGLVGTLVLGVVGLLAASGTAHADTGLSPAPVAAIVATQATTAPADIPATPTGATHVVQRGDSLWKIAEQHYGSGLKWRDLYDANRTLVKDPSVIQPGWSLILPGIAPIPEVKAGEPERPAPVDVPAPQAGSVGQAVAPQPERAPDASVPVVTDQLAQTDGVAVAPLAMGVGALLAAGILARAELSRTVRERGRRPGRRFVERERAAARLEAVAAAQAPLLTRDDLDAALRAVAAHCRGRALPKLDHVRLGETIRFELTEEAGPAPVGFVREERAWVVQRRGIPYLAGGEAPAWPSLVTVGLADGEWILIDPASTSLGVASDADGVLTAWLVELACNGVRVATTSLYESVVTAADLESVVVFETQAELTSAMVRRAAAAGADAPVCLDADAADREPMVVLVPAPPSSELVAACASPALGLLAPAPLEATLTLGAKARLDTPRASLAVEPQQIDTDTLAAVTALLSHAVDADTEPAPWWGDDSTITWLTPRPGPVSAAVLKEPDVSDPPVPAHPRLQLLGPIDLAGAAGEEPPRARRQCIEYAAYLLEHPGATASQMADALVVAEGTRRSNMSRLRKWLGQDPDGEDYLPDAYSGRIVLHERVTSDWQEFCLLVAPGVNRVSADTLAAALDLVRGAPLADAAPTQWVWAEPLRSDMRGAIRDAALRLAELALDAGDIPLVRWATARGLVASPADELLICARMRAEHRCGNVDEVERLALRLTQHARLLGVDLDEETVICIQEVMEGAIRPRRAWV